MVSSIVGINKDMEMYWMIHGNSGILRKKRFLILIQIQIISFGLSRS